MNTIKEPTAEPTTKRPKLKRLHQKTCGDARQKIDVYDDVRRACERKLSEWEQVGIIPPWRPMQNNDWIFGRRADDGQAQRKPHQQSQALPQPQL